MTFDDGGLWIHLLAAASSTPAPPTSGTSSAPPWVAISALVVSVAVLFWNVLSALLKHPRLHVEAIKTVFDYGSPHSESPRFETARILVINTGGEAATITDVGVRVYRPVNFVDRWGFDGEWNLSAGLSKADLPPSSEISGPSVPIRIEAHGSEAWTVSWISPYGDPGENNRVEWFAFASRYRPRMLRRGPKEQFVRIPPQAAWSETDKRVKSYRPRLKRTRANRRHVPFPKEKRLKK